ncbi:MAG: flagellar biosynthetic protein FliO [Thermoleophilia bacterium]
MTRLFIGLVVVVGIIVVVWLLLRKLQRSTMPGFGADAADLVNVVSSTTLGPGRFLHLVRVGESWCWWGRPSIRWHRCCTSGPRWPPACWPTHRG